MVVVVVILLFDLCCVYFCIGVGFCFRYCFGLIFGGGEGNLVVVVIWGCIGKGGGGKKGLNKVLGDLNGKKLLRDFWDWYV